MPQGEKTPQELCDLIEDWAPSHGYGFFQGYHANEFAKIFVFDPQGGQSGAVIPNPHKGRRLKKHQIRYSVHDINTNWRE